MAQSETQTEVAMQTAEPLTIPIQVAAPSQSTDHYIPLRLSGALGHLEQNDLTPVLATQSENISLTGILHSPVCDQIVRDLAITISQRGVCVFPKQKHLTIEDQKLLARKLGQLTCRPNQTTMPDGTVNAELTTLGRHPAKKLVNHSGFSGGAKVKQQSHVDGWHTDSSYEVTLYSPPLLRSMTYFQSHTRNFWKASRQNLYSVVTKLPTFRIACGRDPAARHKMLEQTYATHPCVCANPLTGWKYVYAMGHHLKEFNGLADVESKLIKEHIERLVTENQHLQLRFKWHPDDLVVWDNRATYHCATFDYNAKRVGNRVCGIGERPYLESRSSGRRYAMNLQ